MNNETTPSTQQLLPATFATAKIRIALAALGFASVLFPAVTVTAIGAFSQGVGLAALAGGTAYLIPLVFVIALAAPFNAQLQPYSRLIDIAAAATCVLFVAWGLWSLFDLHNTMAQQDNALAALAGGAPGFRAPRVSDFGSVTPSIGAVALLATTALSFWKAAKA